MKANLVLAAALAALAGAVDAVEWKNVDEDHYLGGRRASEGYLRGKVVLVDRWGLKCPPCRAVLPRIEEIWRSFKTKPFVVIGGHCPGWGAEEDVKKLIASAGLTYPVYEGAGLAVGEPTFNAIPFLYVVDETGKVVYYGHEERNATQAIVSALTDMESPRSLSQWTRFLDFEIEQLPGRAYLRLQEFKKKFPKEAKAYDVQFKRLAGQPDVKKLSELVAFAKKAKDIRPFGPKDKTKKQKFETMVRAAITKYAPLKDADNPWVAQEAKNAIADLTWTLAAL